VLSAWCTPLRMKASDTPAGCAHAD
jgi:hypothetical protein